MIQFSKEFFDREERNGFYIEPMMKNAWAAQLEVLVKVDALCREHGIPYYADFGTMLGAVRHRGFIPWDDDVDICMKRADLEHFREVMEQKQDELKLFDIFNTPEWGAHAAKVVNWDVFTPDRDKIKEYHGFPFTAGVDIFTLDYVPRDKKLEEEQYDILRTIFQAVHLKEEMEEHPLMSVQRIEGTKMLHELLNKIEKGCNIVFSQENPTEQELLILAEEVLSIYGDEDSDYLTLANGLGNGKEYYLSKDAFAEVIYMPFENVTVPVPQGYDEILRVKYGDNYMTPIQAGAGHEYPFYGRLIEKIAQVKYDGNNNEAKKYVQEISIDYYRKFLHKTVDTDVKYEASYFQEETIGGTLVTEERKRIWAALTEVLEEIKRICHNHNLRVFAIGETLQEAVTYHGYAPDAEQLHLAMKRTDYIKFLNVLQSELDPWFDYSNLYMKKEHEDLRCYIFTDDYLCEDEAYAARFHGCPYTVGADISVIDALEDEEKKADVRKTLVGGLLTTAENISKCPPYSEAEISIVGEWQKATKMEIAVGDNLRNEFYRAADMMGGSYRKKSKQVWIPADLQEKKESILQSAWFKSSVEVPFGNTTMPVPAGYEQIVGEGKC